MGMQADLVLFLEKRDPQVAADDVNPRGPPGGFAGSHPERKVSLTACSSLSSLISVFLQAGRALSSKVHLWLEHDRLTRRAIIEVYSL
jgi:hypothetical protein